MTHHAHKGIQPEHLHVYDQNHAAGSVNLDNMIRIHREHVAVGCTVSLSTACLTAELLRLVEADPVTAAIILGVAVERLAAES